MVTTISRPTLRRIQKVSGGNPFCAVELARGLTVDDEGGLSFAESRLPDSLQEAVAERIAKAPADLAPLLRTTSALGRSSVQRAQACPAALVRAFRGLAQNV